MLSGSGGVGGGGGGVWSKPAALVCHICGREYGTSSLKIHLPQCEKMWVQREALKPRHERRPVPKAAASIGGTNAKLDLRNPDAMAAYNEAATKQFNERALVPCPHCGRTFFEDRLVIHLRSCRPGAEAARVGTGRIKAAHEAVAAATPLKANGPGQTYAGGGSVRSPALASPPSAGGSGGLKRLPSSGSSLRSPSSGGGSGGSVSFADQQSPASANSKTPRARAAPARGAAAGARHAPSSSGDWEAEMDDELQAGGGGGGGRGAAPPSKGYSVPAEAGGDVDGDLVPCSLCGRHFNSDRVGKHEQVCRKQQASNAKRAARIAAKAAALPQPGSQKSAGTEAWKSKHEEFQNAIKYARKMTAMQKAGVSLASLPPPPRSENPDYVTCPYCSRRFNQQAGERHIAACKNIINKPKAVGRDAGKAPAPGSMAAQRLKQAGSGGPVAARPLAGFGGGAGGYGSPTSAGGGGFGSPNSAGYGDEYGGYGSPPAQRPGSSGGLQPRTGRAGPMSPPAAAASSSSSASGAARRAPSPGPAARRAPSPGPAAGGMSRSGGIPSVQRQPSSGAGRGYAGAGGGGGGEDLHAKINQLTETVQMLSKAVLSPQGGGGGVGQRAGPASSRAPLAAASRGGGSLCRGCGQANPVAAAKFCPHCGCRS